MGSRLLMWLRGHELPFVRKVATGTFVVECTQAVLASATTTGRITHEVWAFLPTLLMQRQSNRLRLLKKSTLGIRFPTNTGAPLGEK